MQDLRLIGVDEEGRHVLLAGSDDARFRVPIDAALRRAARWETSGAAGSAGSVTAGPREVQALIRAGASAADVAEQTGWSVEKVHRYEGPILAERAYVVELASGVRLRGRGGQGSATAAPRLADRVTARLQARGSRRTPPRGTPGGSVASAGRSGSRSRPEADSAKPPGPSTRQTGRCTPPTTKLAGSARTTSPRRSNRSVSPACTTSRPRVASRAPPVTLRRPSQAIGRPRPRPSTSSRTCGRARPSAAGGPAARVAGTTPRRPNRRPEWRASRRRPRPASRRASRGRSRCRLLA